MIVFIIDKNLYMSGSEQLKHMLFKGQLYISEYIS